jgi:PilZ domain
VNTAPSRQRAEERIPQRMFVRLSFPDGGNFEMAQTIDISRHGARVSTKKPWEPNQHLMIRSLRGHFTSYARVAHCELLEDNSYCLGLELYNPVGDWTRSARPKDS